MCMGIVGLCSVEIQGTWGTNTGHLASQLAAISPNRIGRNFGNLLVFVSSFMDDYRANGDLGGQIQL